MRFAGTITLPQEVFSKLLDMPPEASSSMGFSTSLSWATAAAIKRGQKRVAGRERGVGCDKRARSFTSQPITQVEATIRLAQGVSADDVGTHAGTHDTSSLMYLNPSMLRLDRMGPGKAGDGQGHVGNPAKATAFSVVKSLKCKSRMPANKFAFRLVIGAEIWCHSITGSITLLAAVGGCCDCQPATVKRAVMPLKENARQPSRHTTTGGSDERI